MGEASRRKRERRAGPRVHLDQRERHAEREALHGLDQTALTPIDDRLMAWTADGGYEVVPGGGVSPTQAYMLPSAPRASVYFAPGYVEPQSCGPPMVVTKVDRERKIITVG